MTDSVCQQNTTTALDHLLERLQTFWQQTEYPRVEFDEQWLSPCLGHENDENGVIWQPVLRDEPLGFSALEDALDLTFHSSIPIFYGRYYSETIHTRWHDNPLALVQVWNEDDGIRLQENLVAHILMKRRLKQPETVFIATTDDDMQVVSIVNDSGEVILETLGQKKSTHLADSLSEFLDELEPTQ